MVEALFEFGTIIVLQAHEEEINDIINDAEICDQVDPVPGQQYSVDEVGVVKYQIDDPSDVNAITDEIDDAGLPYSIHWQISETNYANFYSVRFTEQGERLVFQHKGPELPIRVSDLHELLEKGDSEGMRQLVKYHYKQQQYLRWTDQDKRSKLYRMKQAVKPA